MNWRYQIDIYDVAVSLEAVSPNTPAPVVYEGDADGIDIVKWNLTNAYGAFGHGFDPEVTTATDLDYALFSTFGESDVERLGPTPSYDPGIPQGAAT
ncbi:MAG: hypothetical protein ACO4AI_14695 [Prochlorothrix sp.]